MAETKRTEHPLALLFWSQMVLAYGLPGALEIAYWHHGEPGRLAWAVSLIYPAVMIGAAVLVVAIEFSSIYAYLVRRTRRLPGLAVGCIYAVFAFVSFALYQEGTRNATIAWADYVVQGKVMGLLVLLLAIVIEVFATTFVLCQFVAIARRWRRLSRTVEPQAAE